MGVMVTKKSADLYLIAHSHGVAFLDGITDWRENLIVSGERDHRYGDAFQGWFDGAVGGTPFLAEITEESLPWKELEAWVITPRAQVGPLAQLVNINGVLTLQLNKQFSEVLATWNGSSPIVSMLNGNEHARTMLNLLPAYDFIDADIEAVDDDVPIIDDIFVDQHINAWIGAVYPSLVAIRKLVKNQLVHVLPPPPRRNPQLSKQLETLGGLVSSHGFLSDRLRLKWYRRYCRNLTTLLAAIDWHVVSPPESACGSDGLLNEEFAEGITHGNGKYGVLVARKIVASLETLS